MKKSYKDNAILALDIIQGQWLLRDAANFRSTAANFLNRDFASIKGEDNPSPYLSAFNLQKSSLNPSDDSQPKDEKFVLIVPVHGVLTKYDNCIGCATTYVADLLDDYIEDASICGFILDIDSPGGAANAVFPLVSAIRRVQAAGKPIIVHADQCCSAAYWIASQADAIFADNLMSEFGSIGAYISFVDDRNNLQTGRKVIEVYAPESTEKNRSYREALEGKTELMEKELSDLVSKFVAAVKEGRKDIDTEAEGIFAGAVFEAAKSIDIGMINGLGEISDCIQNVFVRANTL